VLGASEAANAAARREVSERAAAIVWRFVAFPVLVGVCVGVGVYLAGAPARIAMGTMTLGVALPGVALLVGLPGALLSRPWERAVVLFSWLRHAWWLMLAWLAMPALAALAAMAWWILGLVSTGSTDPLVLILIVVAPPWATVALVGLLGWCGAWYESERHVVHRPHGRAISVLAGVVLVLAASIVAAVWTGLVVVVHVLPHLLVR
jgi:hypothetical protein